MMNISKRLFIALFAIGVIAGIVGISLTWLMHFIQHHAYGYGLVGHNVIPFRVGVESASPSRRVAALAVCGLVVGWGWYGLKRYGKPLLSIKASLKNPLQGMPFGATIIHALLQIVTVGLGSPLGREVAPREMSSAFASLWVKRFGLNEDEAKILIACASGAGLAAVYNVPLAGAVFTLETLLCLWTPRAIAVALMTSVLATEVARLGLGDLQQYSVPNMHVNNALLWWSVLIGPMLGALAVWFQRTVSLFPRLKRDDKRIIVVALAAFVIIGLLSIYFPAILGNGKAGNQMTFGLMLNGSGSLSLMVVKWIAVLLALAAGAYGGVITPSMMLGSTFALACALGWNHILPTLSPETAAFIGASAFLGVSTKMPVTAMIFILELSRSSVELLLPLGVCMTGAVMLGYWLEARHLASK